MQSRRITHSRVVGLVEGAVLGACLIGAVVVGASVDRPSDRGMRAYGLRLQAQAEAYRQARADDAYAARLDAIARQRADDAYAARLDAIARQRADDAWTARLTGLAEYLAAE